jgi:hypothetical protein
VLTHTKRLSWFVLCEEPRLSRSGCVRSVAMSTVVIAVPDQTRVQEMFDQPNVPPDMFV